MQNTSNAIVIDTAEGIRRYRMLAVKAVLKLEIAGMKDRRFNAAELAREYTGSKERNKAKLLVTYEEWLNKKLNPTPEATPPPRKLTFATERNDVGGGYGRADY